MEGYFVDETKTENCSSCGQKISSNDRFCNSCGSAINEIELETQPKKEPVQVETISSGDVVVQRTAEGLQQKLIKIEKKVLGRNALVLVIFATVFFVIPCFAANMAGFAFALASTIVGIVALKKQQQRTLAIISIVISTVFSILSVLARTWWDLGYVYL